MRLTLMGNTAAGLALLVSALAVSNHALAQQKGSHVESVDERHACQVAGELISAWISDRPKVASFMAGEARNRYVKQLAGFSRSAPRTDIRITGAEVLSCTAHVVKDGIAVRQERRDQITYASTGKVSYVMYGATFHVSPKTWLVDDWQEIPE
jgi:hypothetical protein